MPLQVLALVVMGAAHDGLCALYLRAATADRRGVAALISGLLTAFGYLAWWVIQRDGLAETPLGVMAYALGGALGTYVGLRRRVSEKH